MSLERVVDRFKDVDVAFSSSTVLNWVHRHIGELYKLEASLRSILLSILLRAGSFLFCDEIKDLAANLFIIAVRYVVNEWEAICRYVNNG